MAVFVCGVSSFARPRRNKPKGAVIQMSSAVIEIFRPLFYPNSIAVVGATDNPFKLGFHALTAVTSAGFQGGSRSAAGRCSW